MQGIDVLLGTEVWPWISHTVTIGVIAGAVYTLGRLSFQKWRERPLIEDRTVWTTAANKVTEVAVTVTVFNRSPETMLRFESLRIAKPKGIYFTHLGGERGIVYYCNKDIAPFAPGATQFPSASARAVITEWPPEGASVVIRISIRTRSAWMTFSQRTVSIKLPSTV
jgi:hypothetical protein